MHLTDNSTRVLPLQEGRCYSLSIVGDFNSGSLSAAFLFPEAEQIPIQTGITANTTLQFIAASPKLQLQSSASSPDIAVFLILLPAGAKPLAAPDVDIQLYSVPSRFDSAHSGWKIGDIVHQTGSSLPRIATITFLDVPDDTTYALSFYDEQSTHAQVEFGNTGWTKEDAAAYTASIFNSAGLNLTASASGAVVTLTSNTIGAISGDWIMGLYFPGTDYTFATLTVTQAGYDGFPSGWFIITDLAQLGNADGYQSLGGGGVTFPLMLPNGSSIDIGTIDFGDGGAKGISLYCSAGYQLNNSAGVLRMIAPNGTDIIPISLGTDLKFNGSSKIIDSNYQIAFDPTSRQFYGTDGSTIMLSLADASSAKASIETILLGDLPQLTFVQVAGAWTASEITEIPDNWQYATAYLTGLLVGNKVTRIGSGAFADTTLGGALSIPSSVTEIGSGAFYFTSLSSVILGSGLLTIGESAFTFSALSVLDTTLAVNLTTIGGGAFQECTGLTSITIPNSVTSIGGGAFQNCTGLTSVTIGSGVTSIGGYAFYGCNGLTSITIPNSVTFIDGGAFQNCTGLTSITIPDSVTFIGSSAFQDCTGLTSVTIGSGVTSIGGYAFYGCNGLTSIQCLAVNAPALGSQAFDNVAATEIHVPAGAVSYGTTYGGLTVIDDL